VQYKNILAMIFNEIKCHVNTSLGLVGRMHPLHPPLCPPLVTNCAKTSHLSSTRYVISLRGNMIKCTRHSPADRTIAQSYSSTLALNNEGTFCWFGFVPVWVFISFIHSLILYSCWHNFIQLATSSCQLTRCTVYCILNHCTQTNCNQTRLTKKTTVISTSCGRLMQELWRMQQLRDQNFHNLTLESNVTTTTVIHPSLVHVSRNKFYDNLRTFLTRIAIATM